MKKTITVNPGHVIVLNSNLIHADGGSNKENTHLLPGVVKANPARNKRGRPPKSDKQITHLSFHAYIDIGKAKTCTEGYVKSVSISIDDNQFASVDKE